MQQFNYLFLIKNLLLMNSLLIFNKYLNQFFIFIDCNCAYYITAHIRFSSFFYIPALIDITAFDLTTQCTALCHIFTTGNNFKIYIISIKNIQNMTSVEDFFKNALWFEREVKEMFGTNFINISDNRNLLLPYGYFRTPLKKIINSTADTYIKYSAQSDSLIWEIL